MNLLSLLGPVPGAPGAATDIGPKASTGIGGALFGQSAQAQQLPTTTPQQNDLMSMLTQRLQQLLNPDMQAQLGGAAATQFNQQTLPSLAERFTALGGDVNRSGAFGQQVAQAQQGMLGNLLQGQQQQIPSLMGGALQPQFENVVSPREPGFLEMLLSILGQAGGQAAGMATKAMFL